MPVKLQVMKKQVFISALDLISVTEENIRKQVHVMKSEMHNGLV